MRDPFESIKNFCLIQMEILKDREYRLRKEIQDCKIQEEFLTNLLRDLGDVSRAESDIISNLLDTIGSPKK